MTQLITALVSIYRSMTFLADMYDWKKTAAIDREQDRPPNWIKEIATTTVIMINYMYMNVCCELHYIYIYVKQETRLLH